MMKDEGARIKDILELESLFFVLLLEQDTRHLT